MLSLFCPARLGALSTVWFTAADTHLGLINHVFDSVSVLADGVLECNLLLRQSVVVLCMYAVLDQE